MSTFGCNPCRDGHPEVGGHGDVAVGKQVDVLRHVGITRFEREVGCHQGTHAETGLQRVVEVALHRKSGIVQPDIHLDGFAQCDVVFNIEHGFVGMHITCVGHSVRVGFRFCEVDLHRLHLGTEEMIGVATAEADVVPRVGRVMEIGACRKVMDA